MLMSLIAASSFALVINEQSALRAAPRDSALQQTTLYQGDMVELRGAKLDYLQVYDYRRERAGYVKAQALRKLELDPEHAQENRHIWQYLRDTPGAESLGIAYLAAYLKSAPASDIDAGVFDALGSFAERVAKRGNSKLSKYAETLLAAQLETAAYYGVQIKRFERDGKAWFCYDGEAYRRVLALQAQAELQARAALALTRSDCINPQALESERQAHDLWRAEVLDKVVISAVSELHQQRLRLRKSQVWSAIAFQQARKQQDYLSAGSKANQEFSAVKVSALADEDFPAYDEAALRLGASLWASLPAISTTNSQPRLSVSLKIKEDGRSCLQLIEPQKPGGTPAASAERCTYGQAWLASQRAHPNQQVLTMAVQTLEGWRELWVWHKAQQDWRLDVIPPAASEPDLGYVEFAGWIPGSQEKFLIARESRLDGRLQRRFEVFNLTTMRAENSVDKPAKLAVFNKWQDPLWMRNTISVR